MFARWVGRLDYCVEVSVEKGHHFKDRVDSHLETVVHKV